MRQLATVTALCLTACSGDFQSVFDWGGVDGPFSLYDGGNLVPNRPTCSGEEATLSGTVLAPNGTDPVPGAAVFIPSAVPEIFPPEVQCEVCGTMGGQVNWWYTTSKFDGTFTLSGVCPGRRPLVLQNGRFRRLVWVEIPPKGSLTLPAEQTRLPRKAQEFDLADSIPRIAVATGDYDKMECVLKKVGLEVGAFDLFEGASVLKAPTPLPSFSTLLGSLEKMKQYNIIFINCTGNTFEAELKKPELRQRLSDYVQAGGRLYITDWSYDWIEQVEAFAPFIDFEPGASAATPEPMNAAALGADGLVVQATVVDPELAQWLGLFPGAISGGKARIEHFLVDWVIMLSGGKEAKLWVEGPIKSRDGAITGTRPLTVTFNFKNCGKILYTSYHTEGREMEIFPFDFPQYCGEQASPQDRILEYLIYDIASCIKPIE